MSGLSERLEWSLAHCGNMQAQDLANKIGVAKQTITAIKAGKMPGKRHLPLIGKVLGVDHEWLLTGDPERAPEWARGPTYLTREHEKALAAYVTATEDLRRAMEAAKNAANLGEIRLLLAENNALRQQLAALGIEPIELTRTEKLLAAAGGDLASMKTDPEHDELVRAALAVEHRPPSDLPSGPPPSRTNKRQHSVTKPANP